MIKIQVILASTRQARFGDKPAQWILGEAKKVEGAEAELVDLKEWALPVFEEPTLPAMMGGKYNSEAVQKFANKIKEADAFIIVTPEYNYGYPSALKNALDSIYVEFNNKPVAFVAYGGVGGARAMEQLKQVSIGLQMAPIWHSVNIQGEVMKAIATAGLPIKAEPFAPLAQKTGQMLTQLMWWAKALKTARTQ